MIFYYSIFIFSLITMFLNDVFNLHFLNKFNKKLKIFFLLFLFIIVGFRYKVGSDWNTYNDLFYTIDFTEKSLDIAYFYLIKLSILFSIDIWGLNIFSSFVFFYGFYFLFRDEKYFWFAVNLSLPYLIFIVSMGYTRQSISIGFGMIIIKSIINNNKIYQLFFLLISILFHYTSVLYAGFILYNIKNNFLKILTLLLILILFFILTNQFADLKRYYKYYLLTGAQSYGGIPRLIFATLPIFFYLIKFNQLKLSKYNKLFSLYSLSIFFLLIIAFISTTTADRILLFLLPIKIFLLLKIIEFIKNKYLYIYVLTFIFILSFHLHSIYSISFKEWIPYQNLLTINEYNKSIFFTYD